MPRKVCISQSSPARPRGGLATLGTSGHGRERAGQKEARDHIQQPLVAYKEQEAGTSTPVNRDLPLEEGYLPCTVQARWEAVSREREVGRREGEGSSQPQGPGRQGGGKAWQRAYRASRQPRCRDRLSLELGGGGGGEGRMVAGS